MANQIAPFTRDSEFSFPFPLARTSEDVREELATLLTRNALVGDTEVGRKVVSWAYVIGIAQPDKRDVLTFLGINLEDTVCFISAETLPKVGSLARIRMTIGKFLDACTAPVLEGQLYTTSETACQTYISTYNHHLSITGKVIPKTRKDANVVRLTQNWGKLKKGMALVHKVNHCLTVNCLKLMQGDTMVGDYVRFGCPPNFTLEPEVEEQVVQSFKDVSSYSDVEELIVERHLPVNLMQLAVPALKRTFDTSLFETILTTSHKVYGDVSIGLNFEKLTGPNRDVGAINICSTAPLTFENKVVEVYNPEVPPQGNRPFLGKIVFTRLLVHFKLTDPMVTFAGNYTRRDNTPPIPGKQPPVKRIAFRP